MAKIYERIKAECEKRGTTIKQLEKNAGVANGTVGKWRDGAPRLETIHKIAKALEVTIDDLIGEAE